MSTPSDDASKHVFSAELSDAACLSSVPGRVFGADDQVGGVVIVEVMIGSIKEDSREAIDVLAPSLVAEVACDDGLLDFGQ